MNMPTTGHTRLRSDGRLEVADTGEANDLFGCTRDGWCILTNGHEGDCDEDRELWLGPNTAYPDPAGS